MKFDIIGGGIGGLTTAIALNRKGFETTIFEQADDIKPVGAGIILANNAMQVYDRLGIRESIESSGHIVSSLNITSRDLKVASTVDLTYFERKFGVRNVAIHRGALQKVLLDQLDRNAINLGFKLSEIIQKLDSLKIKFSNGEHRTSEVLIGADGMNSAVRKHIYLESKVRGTNQLCWRGVTKFQLPDQYQNAAFEAWGQGNRFGFVQIEEEQVYWYALITYEGELQNYVHHEIRPHFDAYHPLVTELISSTPSTSIHLSEISDLEPLKYWYKGNVCLLGDAAHATTPNMGQGACQAIEDAYVLSELLAKYELSIAFEKFQKARMTKALDVVKMSRRIGEISHWSNPLAVWLRDKMLRATPQFISRQQSAKIFQLSNV